MGACRGNQAKTKQPKQMTTTTTASNVQLIGMDEVERIYSPGIGRHWFDADSMRFFRTRLPQSAYKGDGGIYFVTSERFTSSRGSLPRAYSVRKLVGEGRIETVGDFNSMTKAQANGMAKRLAAAAAKEEASS